MGVAAKKKTLRAAEQDRPDVKQRRDECQSRRGEIDPCRFRFIDESGAKTNMVRTHGRCPKGERLLASAPAGHWKTTTMLAAIGLDGVEAPWTLDGAMDADAFLVYVEHVLVPTLGGGEIVVLDNLSSHKHPGVAALIESAGAEVWYLPPYSPDMNPIEMVFSKIKQSLRTLKRRTKEALWQSMQPVLDAVTPSDATNCCRHAGYTLHVE